MAFALPFLMFLISSPDDLCIPTADDAGIACTVEKEGADLYGCVKGRAGRKLKRRKRAVLLLSWDIGVGGDVEKVSVRGRKFKVPKPIRRCLKNEIASWMFVPPEETIVIKNTKLVISRR